jgi:hypothetical protein
MADDTEIQASNSRPKRVNGRIDALMEQFKTIAEKTYGKMPEVVQSERVAEEVPYTSVHKEMLSNPDLLETLVRFGDSYVKDVPDLWRALFLAQASCYAPPIMQGEKVNRAQTHILLLGEYSTAKTSIYRMGMKMFPKAIFPTDFSPSAFMGTVKKDGVRVKGIAEESDRSVVIIDEFDKIMAKHPSLDGILRVVMEEQTFYRRVAYGSLAYKTHPVILAGANPKNDVFTNELMMNQIPFKYGLLSRFDYIRPMAYGAEKILSLTRHMADTCFKDIAENNRTMCTEDVLKMFYALQSCLIQKCVRQVVADQGLVQALSHRFEKLQGDVEGVPILSVRDFMAAIRYFNASAILHAEQRELQEFGIVANEIDLDNALYLLDMSARSKVLLLSSRDRMEIVRSPYEKAITYVSTLLVGTTMTKQDVANGLIEALGVCRATAYNYLNDMVAEGKVEQIGLRDSALKMPEVKH